MKFIEWGGVFFNIYDLSSINVPAERKRTSGKNFDIEMYFRAEPSEAAYMWSFKESDERTRYYSELTTRIKTASEE